MNTTQASVPSKEPNGTHMVEPLSRFEANVTIEKEKRLHSLVVAAVLRVLGR